MNDAAAGLAAIALAAAGVIAEINVIRFLFRNRPRSPRSHPRRRPLMGRSRAALAILGLAPAAAMAQDAGLPVYPPAPTPISTDRPSFSDGAGIQPAGRFNLETGYTFTFRDRDGAETRRHNAPELLGRIGVIDDRFELRITTSGYTWSRTADDAGSSSVVDGWSDVALGFKLKVLDQLGWRPRLALGVQSTLGGGSDSISTQIAEPTFKLIWSHDLAQAAGEAWKGFTLGGNLNLALPTTDGDRFAQGQGSIYLGFPIADRWSGFVEYFVIGPAAKDSDAAHYVDLGATWLIHTRIQLDGRVGFGLNQEADNLFAGLGISFLF